MCTSDSTACFRYPQLPLTNPSTDQWSHPLSLDSARDPPFKSHLPLTFILTTVSCLWHPLYNYKFGSVGKQRQTTTQYTTRNWFATDKFESKCFEGELEEQQVCQGGSERLATCCPVVGTILFFQWLAQFSSFSGWHNSLLCAQSHFIQWKA